MLLVFTGYNGAESAVNVKDISMMRATEITDARGNRTTATKIWVRSGQEIVVPESLSETLGRIQTLNEMAQP